MRQGLAASEGRPDLGRQAKKLSLIYTLEILKKYSDEDHQLTQKQIVDLLREEYEMEVDRRTVKTNLMDLIDLGYETDLWRSRG